MDVSSFLIIMQYFEVFFYSLQWMTFVSLVLQVELAT